MVVTIAGLVNPTTKAKLDSIKAKAIRVCLSLPRATANEALQMEDGEIALSLRRDPQNPFLTRLPTD